MSRQLTDRQKDALYRHFFTVGDAGSSVYPGGRTRGDLTDSDFEWMADSVAGAAILASMALQDFVRAVDEEIIALFGRLN